MGLPFTDWIDYKKAYDLVPQSWIKRCLKFCKMSGKVRYLLEYAMPQWRVELTSGGERLADVQIKRGIFQGDSLSPILFLLALIHLSTILNKAKEGYSLAKDRAKLNHLLFMDDLKLYEKTRINWTLWCKQCEYLVVTSGCHSVLRNVLWWR